MNLGTNNFDLFKKHQYCDNPDCPAMVKLTVITFVSKRAKMVKFIVIGALIRPFQFVGERCFLDFGRR